MDNDLFEDIPRNCVTGKNLLVLRLIMDIKVNPANEMGQQIKARNPESDSWNSHERLDAAACIWNPSTL